MCDPEDFDKTLYRVFHEKQPKHPQETAILLATLTIMVFEHNMNCYAPFLYEFGRMTVKPQLYQVLFVRAAIYGHPEAYKEMSVLGIQCDSEDQEQEYIQQLDKRLGE
jgi:hypothetical protein